MNKTYKDVVLNIVLPMAIGVLVYALVQTKTNMVLSIIRNWLPDACWAYAFMSALLITWNRTCPLFWIEFYLK
jgi:glucose uptake protein GlcU